MTEREIVGRLREEYFENLLEIRKVTLQLEAEIRYRTVRVLRSLHSYEQLIIKSRVKECESAVEALRRRQEGNVFSPDRADGYSVLSLRDLAGVRVLAFPRARLIEVDQLLRESPLFADWICDPVPDASGAELANKYYGFCHDASDKIFAEYQVVPMLIGLFWEVEHAAMYKPTGSAKGVDRDEDMKRLRGAVESSLINFEAGFETFVQRNSQPPFPVT
jgi:hypothetical protein